MRIAARSGAVGALIAVLVMGLSACQAQGTVTSIATDEADVTLTSWLAKPEGDGPFPAVVLLHGCTGTERNTPYQTVWRGLNRHAALLNENGYVTLIVDSFGPRGIVQSCRGEYASDQLADAYAAFDHLTSLPFVDGDRIGVVGLSMGGSTALRVAATAHGRVEDRLRGSGRVLSLLLRLPLPLRCAGQDPDRRRRRLDPGPALQRCRLAGPRPRRPDDLSGHPSFVRSAHGRAICH